MALIPITLTALLITLILILLPTLPHIIILTLTLVILSLVTTHITQVLTTPTLILTPLMVQLTALHTLTLILTHLVTLTATLTHQVITQQHMERDQFWELRLTTATVVDVTSPRPYALATLVHKLVTYRGLLINSASDMCPRQVTSALRL